MSRNWKKVLNAMGQHCKIFARGFVRTCYGALTAGLVGLAVYGFVAIGSESGWVAVCDFVATVATVTVAVGCIYHQGCRKRGAVR